MKKILLSLLILFSLSVSAQNYNISNSSISTCAGNFYDSGGAGGNYGSSQNFVMTICPGTPGSAIRIDFSAFNLENNADTMFIYNGDGIDAPLFGQYTGITGPGIVQATGDNPSGCITIRFVSDGTGVASGWAGVISCVTQIGRAHV